MESSKQAANLERLREQARNADWSQQARFKHLVDRQRAQEPMQTVRHEMSEQERKEQEEYIRANNCPF